MTDEVTGVLVVVRMSIVDSLPLKPNNGYRNMT